MRPGTDKIYTVKANIQDKEDIHPNKLRMVLAGKSLNDEDTLDEHHIRKESI